MDTVGEEEGGMKGESSMEPYTLPSVKQIASENLRYEAGSSSQVLCDNLDGWDGKGGGREIQEGGDGCMYVCAMLCLVAQSCPALCNPMDCSPPGSSACGDSPGKNIGVGCHALLQGYMYIYG